MDRTRLKGFAPVVLLAALSAGCFRRDPQAAAEACRKIEWDLRHDRLAQAREAAQKGAAAWASLPVSDSYVTFRLLESEALLNSGKAREALHTLSALQPAGPVLQVRREVDLGNALLKLERFAEARNILDQSTSRAQALSLDALLLDGLVYKGTVLVKLGDLEGASAVWRAALVKAAELNDSYHRAAIYSNQGKVLLSAAEYDRAIPYFERALAALDSSESPRLRSLFLTNLAICLYELGDFDRAFTLQREAISVQQQIGASLNLMNTYGETGRLYHGLGEDRKAAPYYRSALESALRLGAELSAATWAVNLSGSYVQLQDWENARKYNEQARFLSRRSTDDTALYIMVNAAGIEAGTGHPAEAERLFRQVVASPQANPELTWDTYGEIAKLRAAAGDFAEANRNFDQAIALVSKVRAGLSRKDQKLTFLSQPIHLYQEYVDALAAQGDWRKAMLVADSSKAQVLDSAASGLPAKEAGLSLASIQRAAQAAQSVLLFYWLGPRHSRAWIVSAEDARMVELPCNDATVRDLISAYRAEIERGGRDPLYNPSSTGWKLQEAILQPVRPFIPPGAGVIVVPDGALNDLNLETIPVPGPPAHYWIEDVSLSVAPSLSLLARPEPVRADHRREFSGRALIVGDPEPVATFPRLGYAASEIASIERRFSARRTLVLTGPGATPAAYQQARPETFDFIHFTAHAEANRERPLDSAVVLSRQGDEYKLYARDISDAEVRLRAQLVTISACRGAGSKFYSGEGLIGFAWAFLHAGARRVIAGLWDVDDAATPVLMDRLYAGIQASQSPARALRDAKLAFVHSAGNRAKPYYWGPLQVYRRSAQ